jgi:hypothetical protein
MQSNVANMQLAAATPVMCLKLQMAIMLALASSCVFWSLVLAIIGEATLSWPGVLLTRVVAAW